jgi:hypothetical protein
MEGPARLSMRLADRLPLGSLKDRGRHSRNAYMDWASGGFITPSPSRVPDCAGLCDCVTRCVSAATAVCPGVETAGVGGAVGRGVSSIISMRVHAGPAWSATITVPAKPNNDNAQCGYIEACVYRFTARLWRTNCWVLTVRACRVNTTGAHWQVEVHVIV